MLCACGLQLAFHLLSQSLMIQRRFFHFVCRLHWSVWCFDWIVCGWQWVHHPLNSNRSSLMNYFFHSLFRLPQKFGCCDSVGLVCAVNSYYCPYLHFFWIVTNVLTLPQPHRRCSSSFHEIFLRPLFLFVPCSIVFTNIWPTTLFSFRIFFSLMFNWQPNYLLNCNANLMKLINLQFNQNKNFFLYSRFPKWRQHCVSCVLVLTQQCFKQNNENIPRSNVYCNFDSSFDRHSIDFTIILHLLNILWQKIEEDPQFRSLE